MSSRLRKEFLPEGFELADIDVSGELKERSGSTTLLIRIETRRMFNLRAGDEVIAKITAVKRNRDMTSAQSTKA